jgi:hypothetical protein
MKKALVLLLGVCFVALLIGSVEARNSVTDQRIKANDWSSSQFPEITDPGLANLYESAAVDTYYIVWYDFEQMDWQGWARVDNTGQKGTFFHVDDFAGLNGGHWGHLIPLEGNKSMWCGARPNPSDPYMCSWIAAPGYGSYWNQYLTSPAFSFIGAINWSYKCSFDSEDGWDITHVEYDAGNSSWQIVDEWTGRGDSIVTTLLALPQASTKLRYRLSSDSNTNDEDGLLNTDGAFIVDSIRVADNTGVIHFANFEAQAVGATTDGWWTAAPAPGYGRFAGLKTNLADKDPCGDNFGTQIVFFIGSPFPSASYPGLYDTPFCTGPGNKRAPCQDEMIISPVIDMHRYSTAKNAVQDALIPVGDLNLLGGTLALWTVYRDLPDVNCVFYTWSVRRLDPLKNNCPTSWYNLNFVYYGANKDYIFTGQDVSKWLATNDDVQIGFGVIDMCEYWGTTTCNCIAHTPSPWFDQIRLLRYKTEGPQYTYRDLDIFQDNFPEAEYDIESYVRADMADDINLAANPAIRPGDSMVVDATSPLGGGIAADHAGGPAVYLHVMCKYIGTANPLAKPLYINGAQLAPPLGRGPGKYDPHYVPAPAANWNIIQCDSSVGAGGSRPVNRWAVDLNDSLFTRGYKIMYYFTAKDVAGIETALPWNARSRTDRYFEFTCLPTKNSDVLFVDDFTGRGSFNGSVEDYWNPVFKAVLPGTSTDVETYVDRYDVNGPSSGVDNGPGSRAKNAQMTEYYYKIVWDCGDLSAYTITDGVNDKSNDCAMLVDWLSLAQHRVGLWICGDNVAADLKLLGTPITITLMQTWCGTDLTNGSYFEATGGRPNGTVTPLVVGDLGPAGAGIFQHSSVADQWYVFGGCAIINDFDVLKTVGTTSKVAAHYPPVLAVAQPAAIANDRTNSGGNMVRTMWFGFSYMYIRDDVKASPEDRFDIARDELAWEQQTVRPDVSQAPAPRAYKLLQNAPNPFNPSTSIKFDMKDKGVVTLKIYNVAGQLVRTLMNGTKDVGSYTVTWDGKNDRGGAVASGVYFYKMETKDFSQTRKMVMLR